jgi:glycosyltransferase involved in cell wall biosynthesis
MSKHKGFHLVEAALRQSQLTNLELTVVDFSQPPGAVARTTWGGTPVRIIGKVPQDQVHSLYAELDVLLAPSIWPESFGLVTREALAGGLWVVASDRGAIGEDVQPGVNGFVVDVSNVDGLLGALTAVNASPAAYLQSPAMRPRLRTAEDQARELLDVYAEVLSRPKPEPGQLRPLACPEPVRPKIRASARG